jgi:hypothetical protein
MGLSRTEGLMKYVVFEDPKTKWWFPVCFPDAVTHSMIKIEGLVPVSAGFVNVMSGECIGSSPSLKLKARREDKPYVIAVLTNNGTLLTQLNCNRLFT